MPVCFFDTNVLVYCVDPRDATKQRRARQLVALHGAANEVRVSTQVLIELYAVLTRKLRVPTAEVCTLVSACMAWPVVESDLALVSASIETAALHEVAIFDAMVVEAARRAEASTLYSEDLQHGRHFGELRLVNPFA